ncbi:MAG: sugar transferase [Pseudomonadota bacterium]
MLVRIFNHYVPLPLLMLGLVEAVLLIASVYAGVALRIALYGPGAESLGPLFLRGVVYAVVVVICMVAMGLYHARVKPRLLGIAVRLVAGFALGGVVLALLFYVFPDMYIGRGALALAFAVSIVSIIAARALFYAYIDENIFRRRVLIYGSGEKAASILRLAERVDSRGFRLLGCVASPNEVRRVDPKLCVELSGSLTEYAREKKIDEIVVAIDDRRRGLPVHELLACKLDGIEVTDALTFFERATGMVKLDLLYPSWMIFSDGFNSSVLRSWTGGLLDVSGSLLLLTLTWPIMLVCAIAIKIEDGLGAPVLYRQTRVGYKGRPFNVLLRA